MIILDTNVLFDLMRGGDPKVRRWLETVPAEDMYTTVITRSEIRYGVARLPVDRRRDDPKLRADALFAKISDRTLVFNAAAADRYGLLVAERVAVGRPISVPDAQIASIAHVHFATLATRNTGDFDACGVELVNPFNDVA